MSSHSDSPFLPRTIVLIGKYNTPEIVEPLVRLAESLRERGITVLIETQTALQIGLDACWQRVDLEAMGVDVDLAIVLGGDGTMLNAARRLARFGVALLGVNQGRLGFLADIARENLLSYLDDLLGGRFRCERRMLLTADVIRDGEVIATHVALNDVVVDKGAIGRMIDLELRVDDEFIYSLRSDGLIISTPTGSTAYSMSAGGPIVHPKASGIVLVPLCPHALSNRPILVNDDADVEVRICAATDPRVHFDGQTTLDLQKNDSVRLKRCEHDIRLMHPPGYSYFSMLRQKLHWSEHPRGH